MERVIIQLLFYLLLLSFAFADSFIEGTGMNFAYVRLDVQGREITDISLLIRYPHLRY